MNILFYECKFCHRILPSVITCDCLIDEKNKGEVFKVLSVYDGHDQILMTSLSKLKKINQPQEKKMPLKIWDEKEVNTEELFLKLREDTTDIDLLVTNREGSRNVVLLSVNKTNKKIRRIANGMGKNQLGFDTDEYGKVKID